MPRIRIHARVYKDAFLIVIRVPVVARQFLEVPHEFAGGDVEGHSRIAIELRRRRVRHRVIAGVTLEACVRVRVGNAPIDDLANRIVGAGESPWASRTRFNRQLPPRIAARFAGRGGYVETPDFFSGPRVVRGDETELAFALIARAVRDNLAVRHEQSA